LFWFFCVYLLIRVFTRVAELCSLRLAMFRFAIMKIANGINAIKETAPTLRRATTASTLWQVIF